MAQVSKEYFDEKIDELAGQIVQVADQLGQTNRLLDTFATATAQRFDSLESEIGEVKAVVLRQEEDIEEIKRDQRKLRDHLEQNLGSRISNLEAQVN